MFAGWARTGEGFKAYAAGSYNDGTVRPVCRFYGLPSAGLDSHFYSASPAECFAVDERLTKNSSPSNRNAPRGVMPR